jgi:hypothetical protein
MRWRRPLLNIKVMMLSKPNAIFQRLRFGTAQVPEFPSLELNEHGGFQ